MSDENGKRERELAQLITSSMVACDLSGRALDAGEYTRALDHAQHALELEPGNPFAWLGLARCQMESYEHAAAVITLAQALELAPLEHAVWNNVFFNLLYFEPSGLAHAHAVDQWSRLHEWAPRDPTWRHPGGIIRVGFQSADFCAHPVGRFIAPVLALLDRKRFAVYGYHVGRMDQATNRLAAWCDRWYWQPMGMHEAVEAQVREDGIDVLIDLAGHTHGSMLAEVFANRPAPVQVSYLGYPAPTGARSIDYRLVSRYTDAPAELPGEPEAALRLVSPFLACFAYDRPISARSPAYTFGSFNRTHKITTAMLELWARCLHAAGPHSTMLLKARGFADARLVALTLDHFTALDISPRRIACVPIVSDFDAHMLLWEQIGCALDTFPYSGTTTTMDALHMGVPVVSLCGSQHASRVSACILSATGQAALIASSEAEYVSLAAAVARYGAGSLGLRGDRAQRARHFNAWSNSHCHELAAQIGEALEAAVKR